MVSWSGEIFADLPISIAIALCSGDPERNAGAFNGNSLVQRGLPLMGWCGDKIMGSIIRYEEQIIICRYGSADFCDIRGSNVGSKVAGIRKRRGPLALRKLPAKLCIMHSAHSRRTSRIFCSKKTLAYFWYRGFNCSGCKLTRPIALRSGLIRRNVCRLLSRSRS